MEWMDNMLIKLADDINLKELQAQKKTILNFRSIKYKCKNNPGVWEGKGWNSIETNARHTVLYLGKNNQMYKYGMWKDQQRRIWGNCELQAEEKSEELSLSWEKQTPYWDI